MSKRSGPNRSHLPKGLVILYEDGDIIVVDKPVGFLTMGEETGRTRTVWHILTDYVRKGSVYSRKRVFTVHRLDRETSGALIFAKSMEAKDKLKNQWKDTRKKYLAIVHGWCEKLTDTLSCYLIEDENYDVHSTNDTHNGRLARLAYKVLKIKGKYSLLEIDLLTGQKHQIRVQMADIGHPIVGDLRYGRETKNYERMALHALSISFRHPVNNKELKFRTEVPEFFHKLMGEFEILE